MQCYGDGDSVSGNKKNNADIRQAILSGSVTRDDIYEALKNKKVDYVFTVISFSIRTRDNQEIVTLLKGVWNLRKNQYPDLAWDVLSDPYIKVALAQTLGQIEKGNDEYGALLREYLSNDDAKTRGAASVALGIIGNDDDINALVKVVRRGPDYASLHAIYGLTSLGTDKAYMTLEELKKQYKSDDVILSAIKKGLMKMERYKGSKK